MAQNGEVLVEVKNLCKNFGVTRALVNVDMKVRRGEICGLIGENGSGKSTISSIIAGIQTATSGEMFYKGQPWKPSTALEAERNGIAMIVQEAGTIERIKVSENIFLGNYKPFQVGPAVNPKKMRDEAQKALDAIGAGHINPSKPTGHYDMQERKLIEIAKAVYGQPEVLVVDETTTALSQTGRDLLYKLMHDLANDNKAVVFISHDLQELMEHCDTLTILRDGVIVDNMEKKDYESENIKHKMVGREISGDYYRKDMDGYDDEVVLKADCITTMDELLCFDLELHKGEILGIGGLSSCGMHALGRALYGLDEVVDGEVTMPGKNVKITKAETAFSQGMGYISKNRDTESLELNASVGANIQSTGYKKNRWFGPIMSGKKERQYAQLQVDSLAIKCVNIFQPVRAMSGGNKQKVVFGKWIAADAEILIMDCPTRGVDIGVKAEMYRLIHEMKGKRKSIVMISEEMPELIGMADRLLIMKDGKISGEFLRKDGFDDKKIITCMI